MAAGSVPGNIIGPFCLQHLFHAERALIAKNFPETIADDRWASPQDEPTFQKFCELHLKQALALFSPLRCLLCHGINPCFPLVFNHRIVGKPCACPSAVVRLQGSRHKQLLDAFKAFLSVSFRLEIDEPFLRSVADCANGTLIQPLEIEWILPLASRKPQKPLRKQSPEQRTGPRNRRKRQRPCVLALDDANQGVPADGSEFLCVASNSAPNDLEPNQSSLVLYIDPFSSIAVDVSE